MRNNDPIELAHSGGTLNQWSAAQAAVIGSMLIDERCIGEVLQATTPEMFENSTFRHIYEAIRKVWMERRPTDPVTVLHALNANTESYANVMADCMKVTPTSARALEYCEILADCLRLHTFRTAAYELLDAPTSEDASQVWQELGAKLMSGKKKKVISYREMMSDFMDRMSDKTPPDFIDWGFPALNEVLTVTHGRFVVIGAESSVGKTAFALQLARGMAKAGKKVGFFSLETSAPDAADRLMANAADVYLPAIKHRRLNAAEIVRCTHEAEAMFEADFDLIEAAGYSAEEIREDTLAAGYEVIFVDYVQIVRADEKEVTDQVRSVSIALHNLAINLHCTVIALSQVTPPERSKVTGRRRELSMWNLRESRQLAQDGEAVLMMELSDPSDYSSNRFLTIAKNKDGPCGRMCLSFDAGHMRFEYVPAFEDPDQVKADARNAVMDRNREERQRKAQNGGEIEGQQAFRELDDDEGGENPF